MHMELTMRVENGKLVAPFQNEVENLALETIGTTDGIYFDKIPINDNQYLKFDHNLNTWVLHTKGDSKT